MATFKVLLDKRRQRKDLRYPLVIRVFTGRTFRNVNLKTPLLEEEFDDGTQRVIKHPNRKEINQKITQTMIQLQDASLKMELSDESTNAKKIKARVIKPQTNLNFIQYGEKISQAMQDAGRLGNAAAYSWALIALKKYTEKDSVQFREITYEFLSGFTNKMLSEGLKKNSIAAYHRAIRAIFNRAINENIIDIKYYPYRKFKIKGQSTAKRNISKENMAAIFNFIAEEGTALWHHKNFFELCFNLRGISFADMATIKPTDIANGRLTYRRKKTHKLYNIKLTEKAKEIFMIYQGSHSIYSLPIVPTGIEPNSEKERIAIQWQIKTTNKYLDIIGKEIGLGLKLTTYVARHSWATIAKRMGYSKDLIAEALGHEFGNKVTGIYLDNFDQEVVDEMNERVCDF